MSPREYRPMLRTSGSTTSDFVSRLVESLPGEVGDSEHVEYLEVVDRALLDRHVSEREKDALVQVASDLSIDQEQARRLHIMYLEDLASLAWADGIVTLEERTDLARVTELSGVPHDQVKAVLSQPTEEESSSRSCRFSLAKGDRVVFTGQMKRPRDEWYADALAVGLDPADSVTKEPS